MDPKTGEVSDTPVGIMDVYQEFNELSEKFKIMKFKSKVLPLIIDSKASLSFFRKWKILCVCASCALSYCRKWRGTMPSKYLMCLLSANTWKSDIL